MPPRKNKKVAKAEKAPPSAPKEQENEDSNSEKAPAPARKNKKIAKAEKAAPSARKEKQKEEPTGEELFSQSFRDRLKHFSALTKDVLAQKAQSDGTSSS